MTDDGRMRESVATIREAARSMAEAMNSIRQELRDQEKTSTEQTIALELIRRDLDRLGSDVERIDKHTSELAKSSTDMKVRMARLEESLEPEEYERERARGTTGPHADVHAATAEEKRARAKMWLALAVALAGSGGVGAAVQWFASGP